MASWVEGFAHFTEDFLKSDEFFAFLVPTTLYWIFSGFYMMLGNLETYRLHPKKEEDLKNLVSKREVLRGVLRHQAIQIVIVALFYKITGGDNGVAKDAPAPSLMVIARQFFVAMLVADTWNYFGHRYMHENKFLYRHVHSVHHKLYVPYAFGSVYNHPVDTLMDMIGAGLSMAVSGMSPRTSVYFFSFAIVKTVDDHCGMWLPGNIFRVLFWNNTAYHDSHHQLYGNKYNFAQPFFVTWDKICGTYLPYTVEKKEGGGYEVKPVKEE